LYKFNAGVFAFVEHMNGQIKQVLNWIDVSQR